eukprot:3324740-Pyramimonas_sp.AAC.1
MAYTRAASCLGGLDRRIRSETHLVPYLGLTVRLAGGEPMPVASVRCALAVEAGVMPRYYGSFVILMRLMGEKLV